MALVPPPGARFPDPTGVDFSVPETAQAFMVNMVTSLTKALAERSADTTPKPERFFTSPDGSIYQMTLTDAGVPVYTKTNKIKKFVP